MESRNSKYAHSAPIVANTHIQQPTRKWVQTTKPTHTCHLFIINPSEASRKVNRHPYKPKTPPQPPLPSKLSHMDAIMQCFSTQRLQISTHTRPRAPTHTHTPLLTTPPQQSSVSHGAGSVACGAAAVFAPARCSCCCCCCRCRHCSHHLREHFPPSKRGCVRQLH